jgi:hypothetical protein
LSQSSGSEAWLSLSHAPNAAGVSNAWMRVLSISGTRRTPHVTESLRRTTLGQRLAAENIETLKIMALVSAFRRDFIVPNNAQGQGLGLTQFAPRAGRKR